MNTPRFNLVTVARCVYVTEFGCAVRERVEIDEDGREHTDIVLSGPRPSPKPESAERPQR